MKSFRANTATEGTRLFLIFLFAYTSVNKLLNLPVFMQTMMAAHIPEGMAKIIAVCIPISEAILVVLLMLNQTKRLGLYISLLMLLFFTAYIIYMKLWLPKLPCSCGGIIQKLTWNQHLLLNVFIIVLLYYVIRADKKDTQNLYCNKQVTSCNPAKKSKRHLILNYDYEKTIQFFKRKRSNFSSSVRLSYECETGKSCYISN